VTGAPPGPDLQQKLSFGRPRPSAARRLAADESGWSHLGAFGSYLQKIQPDFDSRLHGHKKLSDLVRAHPELFLTEKRVAQGSNFKVLYVKAKSGPSSSA
jgi:hypothetical protein